MVNAVGPSKKEVQQHYHSSGLAVSPEVHRRCVSVYGSTRRLPVDSAKKKVQLARWMSAFLAVICEM